MALSSGKIYVYHLICRFLPPTKLFKFKAKMLRWCGAKIGQNTEIVSSAKFFGGFNLEIGDNVYIGHEALIFGHNQSSIVLEDNCKVGSRVVIVTGSHEFTPEGPCIEGPGVYANVRIGRGAAISTGSTILPGKTVGEMSHVAPGAMVTKDVPPYTRVAGIPAKVIKSFKE